MRLLAHNCGVATRHFFYLVAMKVISAIDSIYILRWLSRPEQQTIRLRLKISSTYLEELRQQLQKEYSVANIAVYVLIEQLTTLEKKRMWGNVRAARYRQRERDKNAPMAIDVSQDTFSQLAYLRQKLDHLNDGVSMDEIIRFLLESQ